MAKRCLSLYCVRVKVAYTLPKRKTSRDSHGLELLELGYVTLTARKSARQAPSCILLMSMVASSMFTYSPADPPYSIKGMLRSTAPCGEGLWRFGEL
jgi:hypothetical protein